MARAVANESSLFVTRVRDLVTRAAVTCAPDSPAIEIARQLSREGVGSVIVAVLAILLKSMGKRKATPSEQAS